MAKKGIKSSYVRASESMANYKASMYDVMTQGKIGEMQLQSMEDKANQNQRLLEASAEVVNYFEGRNQRMANRELVEKGVAIAENNLKLKVNYDKVTLKDVLEKKSKLTEVGTETFKFGNRTFTEAQLIALAKTHEKNEMAYLAGEDVPEPAPISDTSGWTYEQGETKAIEGTSPMSFKIANAMTEENAFNAAEDIYDLGGNRNEDNFTGGIYQWSARNAIVNAMWEDNPNITGLSEDEYEDFQNLSKISLSDVSSDVEKKNANKKLKEYYMKVSDKNSWAQIAPYVRTAESSDNQYAINKNKEGRGFDIGPYQINTRWILDGPDSYKFNADGETLYSAWSAVNDSLQSGLENYEAPVIPSENFGKKEGFDMGDLFGDKSIFNKYENQETINPFGDERYKVLQDYGIIDENWNLYDMNLGDK
jgi:hypothetical protein